MPRMAHNLSIRFTESCQKSRQRIGSKKHPQIVTLYKNQWYLDPGNPKTDDYLLSIVKEIVTNYDVDGIHFDYIRYPPTALTFLTNRNIIVTEKANHATIGAEAISIVL